MNRVKCKFNLSNQSARGFTLIEVLVALVVLAIGMTAVIQFQNSFINTVSEAEKRAMATQVAEEVIEMAKAFDSPASLGKISLPSSISVSYGLSSIDFTIDPAPQYKDETLNSVASLSDASVLELVVTVYPSTGSSAENTVKLSTYIGKIAPDGSPLAGGAGVGGRTPDVSHAVGSVPDVIPIELGNDLIRETALPLPETTNKSISTEVQVLTVNYDTSTNQQVREDFLTVNCLCTLRERNGTNSTPYHYRYNASKDKLEVKVGKEAETQFKGDLYDPPGGPGQSSYCTKCCSGHHDPKNIDSLYDSYPSYKQGLHDASGGPHDHYKFNILNGIVSNEEDNKAEPGDQYLEACRFRRVDGIYELFPDWHLIDLTNFSLSFGGESGNVAAYQQYVKDKLRETVFTPSVLDEFGTSIVSAAFATEQYEAAPNSYNQILARGIYYDDMSYDTAWKERRSAIAASQAWVSQSSPDWLGFVAFNEVNLTLLADWRDDFDPNVVVTVTDEEVEDTDPDDPYAVGADGIPGTKDDDGYYSRGNAQTAQTALVGSSTYITAESKIDNTGILGNRYGVGAVAYAGNDNSIVPPVYPIVSGAVNLTINSDTNIRVFVTKSGKVNLDKVSVAFEDDVATEYACSLESVDAEKTMGTFNCDISGFSVGDLLKVTASTSQKGEEIKTPASVSVTVGTVFEVNFILQNTPK